jgi:K+-sensing histidine kinase KdpD
MGLDVAGERALFPAEARIEAHKALLRAAEELQTQLDEQGILRVIATQLAGVVPYDNGLSVYLLTPDGERLQPIYADGPFSEDILAEPAFSIDQGISGSVARTGRARIANDAMGSADVRVVDGTTDDSLNMLAVPLRSHKHVLGVLVLYRALDWLFLPDDLDLAQLFANQAAIAIDNARLYASALELADGLQTAQNIATTITRLTDVRAICDAIGGELAKLLSYDSYRVYLYEPQSEELAEMALGGPDADYIGGDPALRVRLGEGVTGWVAQHRQPQLVNDLNADPRSVLIPGTSDVDESLLAVPLVHDERLLGVITVTRRGRNRFRPSHLRVLTILAGQVATAIENARLLAGERERINVLEELDRMRADFVSTVSHELRTPLTGIIGFTETLQSYWERMSDDKKLEMVDKIRLSGLRLERLVRDLLFISRVESGNVPLQFDAVDVAGTVTTAVQEIGGKYRGQRVDVEAPPQPVYVQADYDRLCQVMVNLLDNAVKYSPEGLPVTVQWAAVGDEAVISVRDHGRGIAAEDLPRLFTRFGKIGTTSRAGHGGTGLGLYISRGMVEGMHGRIWVDSAPGQGSAFNVALPLASD